MWSTAWYYCALESWRDNALTFTRTVCQKAQVLNLETSWDISGHHSRGGIDSAADMPWIDNRDETVFDSVWCHQTHDRSFRGASPECWIPGADLVCHRVKAVVVVVGGQKKKKWKLAHVAISVQSNCSITGLCPEKPPASEVCEQSLWEQSRQRKELACCQLIAYHGRGPPEDLSRLLQCRLPGLLWEQNEVTP